MAYWHTTLGPRASAIRFVATPYGSVPTDPEAQQRLHSFEYKGITYPQAAVLFAGHAYNYVGHLPFCKDFNPYALPSIEVTPDNFDKILASLA